MQPITSAERIALALELRRLWVEDGCPRNMTDFVNRLDVWQIMQRLDPDVFQPRS